LTFGTRALRIAQETGDRSLETEAHFLLAASEHNVGNFRRSLEHLAPLLSESGLRESETIVVEKPQCLPALARYWTVFCCIQLGEFDRARRTVDEGFCLLDAQADFLQTQALFLHITNGRLLNAVGDFEAAIRAYEAGFGAYHEDYHGNFYSPLAWGLGLAYGLSGRVEQSLEQFDRAEAVAASRGGKSFSGMWLLHFSRALIAAGRLDEASEMARQALSLNSKNGERPAEAGALGLLGEVEMRRDPIPAEEMEHHLVTALALAESMEMRPLAARCHLRLGWLYSRIGHREADRHRSAAESLLKLMGRPRSLDAAGVH
jgi:tetratricopeptide (TPR) repeat protein